MPQTLELSYDSPRRASLTLARFANQRSFQLTTLMLWAFFFNREGFSVPSGNEVVYLVYFWKAFHPHFLSTDWTFQETTAGHAIFNYAFGWVTLLMPLRSAAWLGRVVCWFATFIGLLKVGGHFKIPGWACWLGIMLWLIVGQSPGVKIEWMVGTFEAKCIAYICLLFAIDAAIKGRNLLAGILTGIGFTFHSAVGMWGGAALGFVVLMFNPFRETAIFSAATILLSLPGLISSLFLLHGKHAITPEEAKYLVTVCEPACLDPWVFDRLGLVLMPLLLGFGACHAWWLRTHRSVRMMFCFEFATAMFFVLGVFFRFINRFDLLELFPLRVFAVFVLLFFYWQLLGILIDFFSSTSKANELQPSAGLLSCGMFLFLCLPSPVLKVRDILGEYASRFIDIASSHPSTERTCKLGFRDAEIWVAANTPQQDVVIAPPWRGESYYWMQRPLIAEWRAPRYDELTEWRNRIEALVGVVPTNLIDPGEMGPAPQHHFQHLSEADVLRLTARPYNAKWLVTAGNYPFERVFHSYAYSVYRLP